MYDIVLCYARYYIKKMKLRDKRINFTDEWSGGFNIKTAWSNQTKPFL